MCSDCVESWVVAALHTIDRSSTLTVLCDVIHEVEDEVAPLGECALA